MYEDPAIELQAFRDQPRVLAVASAGDTALALARAGHLVTAVDINPAQAAYASDRVGGGPPRRGQADRLLALGRLSLRPAGWTRSRLDALAAMTDRPSQVVEWRHLTSGLSGAALRALFAPAMLRLGYRADFARSAASLHRQLPRRIERGMTVHANASNPWARLLLTGAWPERPEAPGIGTGPGSVVVHVDDVASHLEAVPSGTYDALALSNVLDGAPAHERSRLVAAARHAGAPGAVVVLRTLLRAPDASAAATAATDRALIWGGITTSTVEDLR